MHENCTLCVLRASALTGSAGSTEDLVDLRGRNAQREVALRVAVGILTAKTRLEYEHRTPRRAYA
eukprot:6179271-Pleurochrysis_carterae.AAC.9